MREGLLRGDRFASKLATVHRTGAARTIVSTRVTPLADRIGGLVIACFQGTTSSEVPADVWRDFAGTIFFTRYLVSSEHAARRSAVLQVVVSNEGVVPIHIMIQASVG